MADKFRFYIKRPDYMSHQTDAPVIALHFGEIGFYPIYTRATVERLNAPDVTPAILESAEAASHFGWHCEGAKDAREYVKAKQEAEA
jgi:hypothetical protein